MVLIPSAAQKQQKRFFILTLWPGHVGMNREDNGLNEQHPERDPYDEDEFKTRIRKWWEDMAIPEIAYRCGQMEVSNAGELHGQVAVKTSKSVRAITMMKRHGGHWEPARSPAAVTNYCQKTEGRIEFLGEDGARPGGTRERTEGHGSAKRRAIRMLIQEGLTPEEIAKQDPEAYFTHHRAIDRLWERLNPDDESDSLWQR